MTSTPSSNNNDNNSDYPHTTFTPTDLEFAPVHRVHVAPVESLSTVPQTDQGLVLVDTIRKPGYNEGASRAFYRAGKRLPLHFGSGVNAAIVTAGGLCPGLNNVIRELTLFLYNRYEAKQVWGIRGGWNGFQDYEPLLLTKEWVNAIHHEGGSALKTSRGGLNTDRIIDFLQDKKIAHLYIIGGDGTHRAAYKVHQACRAQNLNIAIAGIPKTIDNDIDYIDRSFGFYSAIEAAQTSIRTALVEARCTLPNGVGVIKLMGRSAGFLSAFAALGSGDVDAVLLPEVPIVLRGERGILPHIFKRVQEKQHAVVVVAEGAGQEFFADQIAEKEAGSGNDKLHPIAEYMVDQIKEYFAEHNQQVRTKFVDPSYSVRAVAANATDSLYCTQLAHNAVHGCMSGLTGFSVGMVNNRTVYIPIPQLVATSPRSMDPRGPIWDRILAMTGQPDTNDMDTPAGAELRKSLSKRQNHPEIFPQLPEPTVH